MPSRFIITDVYIVPHEARECVTWYALAGWFWSERQLPRVGAQAVIRKASGGHVLVTVAARFAWWGQGALRFVEAAADDLPCQSVLVVME